MKNKIVVCIVLLGIIVPAGVVSCGQGDLQTEYDILAEQYEEANEQIGMLQEKAFEAQILQTQYDELTEDNNANLDEIASLEAENEALESERDGLADELEETTGELAEKTADYDNLKVQYDALVGEGMEITAENIEQGLLALISQERKNNGLNELILGPNLQNWARVNSQRMNVSKQTEYYDDTTVPFQRVYIAVGYQSLEQLVNAAMTFWQSHTLTYQDNILDAEAVYGAVGVVQAGDICYITFLASNFS